MPLGIDATSATRELKTSPHPLTEAQLHIDSPYNTRTHTGLPPTPISNPGMAAIEAAAHPAHVSYLYYVAGADGCGEQVFSTSYAQFETNAAAYNAAGTAGTSNVQAQPMPEHCRSAERLCTARRHRLACRPQSLAGDVQGRVRGVRDGGLELPAPAAARRSCSTRPRARSAQWVRRGQRDDPAQAGRARDRRPRERRRRARSARPTRSRSRPDGSIEAENTDAPGLIAALGRSPDAA